MIFPLRFIPFKCRSIRRSDVESFQRCSIAITSRVARLTLSFMSIPRVELPPKVRHKTFGVFFMKHNHAQRLLIVNHVKQGEAIARLSKEYDSILIPPPQKNGEKTPLKTGENTSKIGKISPKFATPPFSLMFSTFSRPFRLSSTSHLRFTYESLTSKNSR